MQTEHDSLNVEEFQTWRTILRAQANVSSAIDKQLVSNHEIGLPDYEVLAYLSEAPEHSLRMTELADGVLLSPSGLTRRLDGLVRQGYVERQPSPSDGRGLLAVLTEAGVAKAQEMHPTYSKGLRERFVDCLQPDDIETLAKLFEPMANDRSS